MTIKRESESFLINSIIGDAIYNEKYISLVLCDSYSNLSTVLLLPY